MRSEGSLTRDLDGTDKILPPRAASIRRLRHPPAARSIAAERAAGKSFPLRDPSRNGRLPTRLASRSVEPDCASRTRVDKLRRIDRPITYFRHVIFGYARVSTADQNPDHQIDALQRAGVTHEDIYIDHASGAKASRPELDNVLRLLRDGDTLKITRLDWTASAARSCIS